MFIKKSFFILIFFFISTLYGYDYFDTDNKHIKIYDTEIYSINPSFGIQRIYEEYKKGNFNSIEGTSYGKGFSDDSFWFSFKVDSIIDEDIFIQIGSINIYNLELFTVYNNKLTNHQTINKSLLQDKSLLDIRPVLFKLGDQHKDKIYFIKVNTQTPLLMNFYIDTKDRVSKEWNKQLLIYMFILGVFFALLIYNIFLYLSLRDKIYLYYIFMVIGFFFLNFYIRLGEFLIDIEYEQYLVQIISCIFFMIIISLYLFTINLLELKSNYQKLHKILKYSLFFAISIFLFSIFIYPMKMGILITNNLFNILIFLIALKVYLDGNKVALLFLIATGVQLISILMMPLLIFGKIPYNFFTYNISLYGLIWDLVFLSFALAYRVKLLDENNKQKELLLTFQSRNSYLGEITGNIAHQWRTPLGELGAILSKLKAKAQYSTIEKESLIDSLSHGNNIAVYLSRTIDTYQDFFRSKKGIGVFSPQKEIEKTLELIKENFNSNKIRIELKNSFEGKIKGNPNEFIQVILSILLNARDSLSKNDIDNRKIVISIDQENKKVLIKISDNGEGIKSKNIKDIFNPYFTTKDEGYGIGLYIVKILVEKKFNGKVSAVSNNLTTFTIEFNI